ncbi:MAG: hypothetical protein NT018_07495 [Armatimonadetes bacterium]|nr:hypothetical protein [Armatimonadota bacterium]
MGSTPKVQKSIRLPDSLPQQTGEEMRAVGFALADSTNLRHWKPCDSGSDNSVVSMLYKRPGDRFQVKFDPNGLTNELRIGLRVDTTDAIEEFLKARGIRGTLTLQLMAQAAIFRTDEPIALDDFVNQLFDPHSGKERQEARRWTWDTMRMIFALRLYGVRAGKWRDPETRGVINLEFRGEPLIALSPGARTFAVDNESPWSDSDIPVTVGFTMGAWGKEARKNQKILQYYGEMQAVLDIPAGKPSGAWAQCMLFNLNQKWREKAKNVAVTTSIRQDKNGNDCKRIAVHWPRKFTRRELLVELFPPDERFSVLDMLNSSNPGRAQRTWDDAVKILKTRKQLSYYKELAPINSSRQGWANDWLDQPLDIRPNKEGKLAAIEIKDSHKKSQSAIKKARAK